MGTSPDQVRAEIEATRGRLSQNVDRLADHTSPARVMRRRTHRVRGAVSGMRERVMGSASGTAGAVQGRTQQAASSVQESAGQAADTVRRTAGQVGEAVGSAPEQAVRQTQGNPLAAGLIAFGAGLLAASLLPTTRAEEQAAAQLTEQAGPALEPAKQAVMESAQHLRDDAAETARQAAQEVKDTATEAARTTKEEAREQTGHVSE
ncbi:DUF3618 domain-containing protein [Streptomyces sp. JB150]|uniref:DUF3618 domain-containing protein n=1 Tax=Streptomyces sp. JB150 TaxID=2714844 RepID=UPI00140B469A|nr:DUF3618 domain-containing protein [Streptomyces sp. JB150]QIJ65670.1 DUF3618 domain-containing protein [Streptomyces sp. JB150]